MEDKVEIIDEDEILIIDADEVFSATEIDIDEDDLEAIKEAEAAVSRSMANVAAAAKLQKVTLEELENAEEARGSAVRRLALKYDIPVNRDWQINLSSGKIILTPERR